MTRLRILGAVLLVVGLVLLGAPAVAGYLAERRRAPAPPAPPEPVTPGGES